MGAGSHDLRALLTSIRVSAAAKGKIGDIYVLLMQEALP